MEAIAGGEIEYFMKSFLTGIGEDFDDYLSIWLSERPLEVANFLIRHNWNNENDSVLWWAKNPHVSAHLEAVFYQNSDAEGAKNLSTAAQLLQNFRELEQLS